MSVRGRVGRTLLLAGAQLILTSAPVFAVGLELAWNHCFGQAGATSIVRPTCDADAGSSTLVVSFRPLTITKLEGIEVFVNFEIGPYCPPNVHGTPNVPLPCWWDYTSGQPRTSQLVPLHVSPTDANGTPLIVCDNHYFLDNGAVGGGGMVFIQPALGQFKGVAAIPAGTGQPVLQDSQQYGFAFRILNGNTLPVGSCWGCTAAMCFVVQTVNLSSLGLPDVVLQNPHPGSENWASWRPDTTPIPNRTWGAIKSIYR